MMQHDECVPDTTVRVMRPDSAGYMRLGKIVARVNAPFPVAVCWDKLAPESGWSFFLPGELERAALVLA